MAPCRYVTDEEWAYLTTNSSIQEHLVNRWATYQSTGEYFRVEITTRRSSIFQIFPDLRDYLKKPFHQLNIKDLERVLGLTEDLLVDLFARMLIGLNDLSRPPQQS